MKTSHNKLDLVGKRFGRLLVLSDSGERKWREVCWECQCDCGNIAVVRGSELTSGRTQSCKCLAREESVKRLTVHGHAATKSPTYVAWNNMLQRCRNPKQAFFSDYGGRGINVCSAWLEFSNFLRDMGIKPPGLTLERKNVNGNYEASNCIWVSPSDQARNKRNNKLTAESAKQIRILRADGLTLKNISSRFNVSAGMVGHICRGKSWVVRHDPVS